MTAGRPGTGLSSIDVNELVRVQERPAIGTERLAAAEELAGEAPFFGIGRAGEDEQVRAFDLRVAIGARLAFHTRGQGLGGVAGEIGC